MTDRKRIYAIHIMDEPEDDNIGEDGRDWGWPPDVRAVYVYRKTRDQVSSLGLYYTRRGDTLANAMQAAGYPVEPLMVGDWIELEYPYRPEYHQIGVKFEIPGRFSDLRSFDARSPLRA